MSERPAQTALLEREPELGIIGEAARRAIRGRGAALAIVGPGGAGKTTLLDRACAQTDGEILHAAGRELEVGFSFGVVRQLLESRVGSMLAARDSGGTGAARLAAPVFRTDPAQIHLPASGVLHGLYWMVADLAEHAPLVIAIDDLHWADLASVRFLIHLAARIRDLRVLLAVAVRSGDPAAGRPEIEELLDQPGVERLAPQPLTQAAVGEMLVTSGMRADRAQAIHLAAGGNPFLTLELIRSDPRGDGGALGADGAGPSAVSRTVDARLRRLGSDAIGLAQAVAILGDECALPEAAELAGLAVGHAQEIVAAMVDAELLRADQRLSFRHPLIRSAVTGQLTDASAAELHRRAANLLLRRGAARERVVAQLLLSPPSGDPTAAQMLAQAGIQALRMSSAETAAAHLRRALAEGAEVADGALLADLGQAELLAGRPDAAIDALRRSCASATDPRTLADRVRLLWLAHVNTGQITAGLALLETTIEQIGGRDGDSRLMLEAEFSTAGVIDVRLLSQAWRRLDPFADLPGETPAERHLLAQLIMREVSTGRTRARDLGDVARRAYGNGAFIQENVVDTTQWVWVIGALIATEQLELAEDALALAQSTADQIGSLETLTTIYDLRAMLDLRVGRLALAEANALYGLTRLREVAATPIRDLIEIGLLRFGIGALTSRGRLDQAERLLAEHGFSDRLVAEFRHSKLLVDRAALRLAQGRLRDALADTDANAAFNSAHGLEDVVDSSWRPVAAAALTGQGELDHARAVADRHLELARTWDLPRDVASALRIRAMVESDLDDRVSRLRQAADTLESAPAPLEEGAIYADLGDALLQSGAPLDARVALKVALDRATRTGALGLQERSMRQLRAAGGRPRRPTISGADALTPAERQIAILAASGQRNRDIAEAQFLSIRTVENTLQRVYRKLNITTRDDLTAALGSDSTAAIPPHRARP